MEKRLSYILVGSFVVILTLSMFAFTYWLAKYGEEGMEHDYYHAYFAESISGLNVESLVKYRGVEVGRVREISINKKNSEEIEVLIEIKKDTPIKKDTYVMLDTQGITGLKYIDLKGGSKNAPRLVSKKGDIATIRVRKSILASLYDDGDIMAKKINTVLDKVESLLNDTNIKEISSIVTNLSSTTKYIDNNKQKITQVFDQINQLKENISKDLKVITNSFVSFSNDGKKFLNHTIETEDTLIPSLTKLGYMGDRVSEASDTTKEFFAGLQHKLDDGEFSFADIIGQNMQVLNETALSLRKLSLKLDEMVDELKNSPSDILYKSRKKIPGPGESHE